MEANLSIHPRNWRNTGNRIKKNTARTPKSGRKRERKLLAKIDARFKAWEAVPENIRKGYRRPGTRKMSQ